MLDTDVLGQVSVTFDEFGQSVTATWSQMTATQSKLTFLSSLTLQPSFNARGYTHRRKVNLGSLEEVDEVSGW